MRTRIGTLRTVLGIGLVLAVSAGCGRKGLQAKAKASVRGEDIVVAVVVEGSPGTRIDAHLDSSPYAEATVGSDGRASLEIVVPLKPSSPTPVGSTLHVNGIKQGLLGAESTHTTVDVSWPAMLRCDRGELSCGPLCKGSIRGGLKFDLETKPEIASFRIGKATIRPKAGTSTGTFPLADLVDERTPLHALRRGRAPVEVAIELVDGQRATASCVLDAEHVDGALAASLGPADKPAKVAANAKGLVGIPQRGGRFFFLGEPANLEDIGFVALLEESARVDRCTYFAAGNGGQVEAAHDITDLAAKLFDRRTGRMIAKRDFPGSKRCPVRVTADKFTPRVKTSYDEDAVKSWLEETMRRP
ncbi:MAG: hypothetical protein JST00_24895 [Deltaproteobacteria bacterium]|nr:hypothetical protein [Deltaproteobacteria bacterium]